jgi:myo-inositol-1(or 4)-monophosphatase
MVSSRLRALYPTFSFMGEETYKPGDKVGAEPTFICDPIDGTTNFLHGFPHACISLGLAVDRKPVVGVVYNPFLDTVYTAIRGQGAYVRSPRPTFGKPRAADDDGMLTRRLPLNHTPFTDGLSGAVVLTEYGHAREGPNYDLKTRTMTKLAAGPKGHDGKAMVHGVRALGSAALNICHVATGAIDVYWEGGGYPWDVCAAWVILTEAGGTMVGANPGVWDNPLESRLYMAVRAMGEDKTKEVVEEFWAVMGDERLDY